MEACDAGAVGETPPFEDKLIDSMMFEQAIASLTDDERGLIDALFFERMTEREYTAKIGIAQKNVNARKKRILEKLKTFIVG